MATTSAVVSIIVPCYNYGHFLTETIDSLHAQTFESWECIIVDDGSTDNTEEIARRLTASDTRIQYLRQPNQGQAAARNRGFLISTGMYIQFLDADDLIETRKLEVQVAYLEAHTDVDIVYGELRYFVKDHRTERLYSMFGQNEPWMPQISGQGKDLVEVLLRLNALGGVSTPLIRRELMVEVGGFDVRLRPVEDWDFWIRCALSNASFHFLAAEGSMVLGRSHAQSDSKQRRLMLHSTLNMRTKLSAILDVPSWRKLNGDLILSDRSGLAILDAKSGQRVRGAMQLLRLGWESRDVKYWIYAIVLPIAIAPWSRPLRRFLRRFSSSHRANEALG